MTYTTAEGRQQLLDTIAQAVERLGAALASLSEAYEQLDERTGERVEETLFHPVQVAYGRARRAYVSFAERHLLPGREFAPAPAVAPGHGVKGLLSGAAAAVSEADRLLSELQDSMLPVEVGDLELRADLQQVRSLVANFGAHTRELERTLGR